MYQTQKMTVIVTLLAGPLVTGFAGCGSPAASVERETIQMEGDRLTNQESTGDEASAKNQTAVATFGAGCFWCVEAVFQELDGVSLVRSGYAGGAVENPTYEQVCSGATGHAEVCQITFDSSRISFQELLEVFWQTHDPTTLNRQGSDFGTQYRSVVYFHDEQQREAAERIKKKLDASGAWDQPIVTEISPLPTFYAAEEYHRDYFRLNPSQGYCQFVIRPKMDKFRKAFSDKLSPSE
jgi:peptide-methionine (S)-S-oxide reductase